MTAEEYRKLLDTNYEDINLEDLTDIRTIIIDESLPLKDRVVQFVKSTKNPVFFKDGRKMIKVAYANNGIKMDDAFINMLLVV